MRSVDEWKSVLRTALREALRARQAHALAVIRETLAAIENAEAPEVDAGSPATQPAAPPAEHAAFASSAAGLGARDVPRRILSAEAVTAIIEREIQERREAVATYTALGRQDEANTLKLQIDVLLALQ